LLIVVSPFLLPPQHITHPVPRKAQAGLRRPAQSSDSFLFSQSVSSLVDPSFRFHRRPSSILLCTAPTFPSRRHHTMAPSLRLICPFYRFPFPLPVQQGVASTRSLHPDGVNHCSKVFYFHLIFYLPSLEVLSLSKFFRYAPPRTGRTVSGLPLFVFHPD